VRLLQALAEFADHNIPDPTFERRRIAYVVVVAPDGSLVEIEEHGQDEQVPRIDGGTNAVNPKFLVDTPQYVFGLGEQPADRRAKCHAAFAQLMADLATQCPDAGLKAVAAFMRKPVPAKAKALSLKGTEWMTFRLQGDKRFVFERPKVRRLWNARIAAAGSDLKAVCRVTGRTAPIAMLHPTIAMPDSKGAKLVSFNLDVSRFEGRKQGANFEVSQDVARAYGAALKFMLERKEDGQLRSAAFFKGDLKGSAMGTVVPFTKDGRSMQPLLDVLMLPFIKDERERSARLEQAWATMTAWCADDELLHVVILKSNQARIMVLDYFERPLSEIAANVLQFRREVLDELARPESETPRAVTLAYLLNTMMGPDGRITPFALGILRAMLCGDPYPQPLAWMRGESGDVWRRAIRRRSQKEPVSMSLDPDNPDQAYQRGRLAAIIKELHYEVTRGRGQLTLVPSIAQAAKMPSYGMQLLQRRALQFIDALERRNNRASAAAYYEVAGKIGPAPIRHTRAQEESFMRGFVDQVQALRERIRRYQEEKNAVDAVEGVEAPAAE